MNSYLDRRGIIINDTIEDLKDGVNLALLLEMLTRKPVKHTDQPKTTAQKLDNLNSCFQLLKSEQVSFSGCTPEGLSHYFPKHLKEFRRITRKR